MSLNRERFLRLERPNSLRVRTRAVPIFLSQVLDSDATFDTCLGCLEDGATSCRLCNLLLSGYLLKLFLRQFERISAARVVEATANYAVLTCRNYGSRRVRRSLLHEMHGILNLVGHGRALCRHSEALAVRVRLLIFSAWVVRSCLYHLVSDVILEAERWLLPTGILLVQTRVLLTCSQSLLGYVFLQASKNNVVRER